jgi:hypothetical protein
MLRKRYAMRRNRGHFFGIPKSQPKLPIWVAGSESKAA